MCDVDIIGFGRTGDKIAHSKSDYHQMLKAFLHPKCEPCQIEFHLRSDWDAHKFTVQHLKNIARDGITEVC